MGRRWMVLFAVGLSVAVVDQWTKYLAVKHLTPGIAMAKAGVSQPLPPDEIEQLNSEVGLFEGLGYFYGTVRKPCAPPVPPSYCPRVEVLKGFWRHHYVENPGAAWGILASANESIRVPFFLLVSSCAVIFILFFFKKISDDQLLMVWSLSFVFGGAIGNLIDRLHLNYVVDFIDWHIGDASWPTFNVADAGITTGVALLMLEWLRDAIQSRKRPEESEGASTS